MSRQYEAFCAIDPLFYDSLSSSDIDIEEYPAARLPVPEGWSRQPLDDWLIYAPSDANLPPQGWKIHVSACLDDAERSSSAGRRRCSCATPSTPPPRGSGKFVTIYPADDAELELICIDCNF